MIIDAHAHIFPEVNGQNIDGPTRGLGYGRMGIGAVGLQMYRTVRPPAQAAPVSLL